MPSLTLSRKSKPDPTTIYVCVESFASLSSPEAVARGDRLRGDSPLVAATFPAYWLPDGATRDELTAARQALLAPREDITPSDPSGPRVAEPIPADRRMRAVRFVIESGIQLAAHGQVFDANSATVKAHRDAFEPAPEE